MNGCCINPPDFGGGGVGNGSILPNVGYCSVGADGFGGAMFAGNGNGPGAVAAIAVAVAALATLAAAVAVLVAAVLKRFTIGCGITGVSKMDGTIGGGIDLSSDLSSDCFVYSSRSLASLAVSSPNLSVAANRSFLRYCNKSA